MRDVLEQMFVSTISEKGGKKYGDSCKKETIFVSKDYIIYCC